MTGSGSLPGPAFFSASARMAATLVTMDTTRISKETGPALRVAELVEPVLADLGFQLVRVRLTGANGATLQIMAERPDGTMLIEDCEQVSRAISPVLEVEDPVSGSYHLEVSSPGIDRPLVRRADFETWSGHVAKIEMAQALAGRKRFRGVLEGYVDGEVRLFIEADEKGASDVLVGLPFDGIAEARLVMTDELLKAAQDRRKDGAVGDGSEWNDDMGPVDADEAAGPAKRSENNV